MLSQEFQESLINTIADKVIDIVKDNLVQDKRYNQSELMKLLNIGQSTVYELNRRGLRPTKVGRHYIYLESEINKFLKENTI